MISKEQYVREIGLYDLCVYILRKWKIIIVSTLIFTILLSLYGLYCKNRDSVSSELSISELTINMTNEEIQDVEDTADIIKDYKTAYEQQKTYNEESILQNLDAFAINTCTLTFYIDNNYEVIYPVVESSNNVLPITQTYVDLFNDLELYNEVSSKFNQDKPSLYYKELVSINSDDKESGVFSVKIYGEDEKFLVDYSEIIEKYLFSKSEELQKLYGQHVIELVSNSFSVENDSSVYNIQQENISKIASIYSTMNSLESSFSGDQYTYLKKLIHEEKETTVNVLKYVVIGFALGIIVPVFALILIYLFTDKIKNSRELAYSFGWFLLGELKYKDKNLSETNENALEVIVAQINALEFSNDDNLFIFSENNVIQEHTDLVENILKTKLGINVFCHTNLDSGKAIEDLSKSKNAIVVCQNNKSRFSNVKNFVSGCNYNDVNIIGYISLE